MMQNALLTRTNLRTPRAAAIAGILFSLLAVADYRAADLGRHQVCGTRTAQNRSTASATALATVALRAGDESTCSSARLTIIPASRSTAGIRDSYSTAI